MTTKEMVKELRQRHFAYVEYLEKENKELRQTIQNAVVRCQECQHKSNASKTLEQEIVRCDECKWWKNNRCNSYETNVIGITSPQWFCADGERKVQE